MRALRVVLAVFTILGLASNIQTRAQAREGQPAVPEPPILRCLDPVEGVTWERWMGGGDAVLNEWCASVGKPVFQSPIYVPPADIIGLQIVSWNVHVGGGRVEDFLAARLEESARSSTGVVVLLQETFRGGWDVPESYPPSLNVPSAIRPRRPAPDIVALATRFGLFSAYVPSMRNGSATNLSEREDRGNAVLSTEPLSNVVAIELPFGRQRRVAIAATVTARGSHGKPLRIINLHFDTDDHRVMQADALAAKVKALVEARTMPLIVAGDLNAKTGLQDRAVAIVSDQIHRDDGCGMGRTFRLPLRLDALSTGRLDYVFSTLDQFGMTSTCETLGKTMGSDHVPVVMTVRY